MEDCGLLKISSITDEKSTFIFIMDSIVLITFSRIMS